MATNRRSHVDLYCCMSQITRFYRNQYIYFAHEVSRVSSIQGRLQVPQGRQGKPRFFLTDTCLFCQKETTNILMSYWCFYSWKLSWQTTLLTRDDKALTCCLCLQNIENYCKSWSDWMRLQRKREWWRQSSIRDTDAKLLSLSEISIGSLSFHSSSG